MQVLEISRVLFVQIAEPPTQATMILFLSRYVELGDFILLVIIYFALKLSFLSSTYYGRLIFK